MQGIDSNDLVDIIDQSVQHAIRATRDDHKAFDLRDPLDRGPLMRSVMRAVAGGVLVALLCFSAVGGAVAWWLAADREDGKSAWSYRIEGVADAEWSATMNNLGRDGWELVNCRRATEAGSGEALYECIFKRPK